MLDKIESLSRYFIVFAVIYTFFFFEEKLYLAQMDIINHMINEIDKKLNTIITKRIKYERHWF